MNLTFPRFPTYQIWLTKIWQWCTRPMKLLKWLTTFCWRGKCGAISGSTWRTSIVKFWKITSMRKSRECSLETSTIVWYWKVENKNHAQQKLWKIRNFVEHFFLQLFQMLICYLFNYVKIYLQFNVLFIANKRLLLVYKLRNFNPSSVSVLKVKRVTRWEKFS